MSDGLKHQGEALVIEDHAQLRRGEQVSARADDHCRIEADLLHALPEIVILNFRLQIEDAQSLGRHEPEKRNAGGHVSEQTDQEAIPLTGPYASGAPAIFIDQVARMGQKCTIISTVGNDDFGRLNTSRLAHDGVNIAAIAVDPDKPTGTAFVRYRADGSRDFVFNIRHSACGSLHLNAAAEEALATADHLHIMGSSVSSQEYTSLNLKTAKSVKARGGTVSFDPNLRKELFSNSSITGFVEEFLSMTDLYLPSGDEIFLLNSEKTPEKAVQWLLNRGVKSVVHKLGADGARYYDHTTELFVPGFDVEEIDPTGAGDCFGGAFTSLWLQGADPARALTLACAAGALAVTVRGPMEGTTPLKALEYFVAKHQEAAE